MSDVQSTFHMALCNLLAELFDGLPGRPGYMLNAGDPGMLRQLEALDARVASSRTMPGRTTIAVHVDHVLYGLDLLNRWCAGEENPWATADWSASWKRGQVDEQAWRDLLARLRSAVQTWQRNVAARKEWDNIAATGAIASLAHSAYHLGAIRQLIAAAGVEGAP